MRCVSGEFCTVLQAVFHQCIVIGIDDQTIVGGIVDSPHTNTVVIGVTAGIIFDRTRHGKNCIHALAVELRGIERAYQYGVCDNVFVIQNFRRTLMIHIGILAEIQKAVHIPLNQTAFHKGIRRIQQIQFVLFYLSHCQSFSGVMIAP